MAAAFSLDPNNYNPDKGSLLVWIDPATPSSSCTKNLGNASDTLQVRGAAAALGSRRLTAHRLGLSACFAAGTEAARRASGLKVSPLLTNAPQLVFSDEFEGKDRNLAAGAKDARWTAEDMYYFPTEASRRASWTAFL